MPITLRSLALGILLTVTLGCERSTPRAERAQEPLLSATTTTTSAKPKSSVHPLDVSLTFPNVESVGAKKRIRWEKTLASEAHSPPDALKIDFEKSGGFAALCWRNKPGNEGEAPGDDLSKAGYRRISFWAKGAAGGEVVEFRAGGMGNVKTRHQDTFDVTAGKLRLTTNWTEYGIYVSNADLSSVITPFCAGFHREDNAEHTIVYLDDIQYGG